MNVIKIVKNGCNHYRIWEDKTIESIQQITYNNAVVDGVEEGSFTEEEKNKLEKGNYVG